MTPFSAISCRPVSRSMTISAPWPSCDSRSAALATSAATWTAVDCSAGEISQPERAQTADPVERSPQFGLEDDHQGEETDVRPRLQDDRQQPQIERHGGAVDEEKQAHADDEPNRARPPDQAEEPVDQEGRDRDIGHDVRADLVEHRLDQWHRRVSVYREAGLPLLASRTGRTARRRPARRAALGAEDREPLVVSGKARLATAHSRWRVSSSSFSSASRPSRTSFSAASDVQPRATYSSTSTR